VVGAGAWGTALAAHLARAGHGVCLWARESHVVGDISSRCRNDAFLPGIRLPEGLSASEELAETLAGVDVALVVTPSEFCRAIYRELAGALPAAATLVSATKGIELDSLSRMTEVAEEEVPEHRVAVLSGPSFAAEVARGQPTAVVVAADEIAVAESLQGPLSSSTFRVYSSNDVVGVELAGALKNVIAIAAGIVDGLGHGHNTVAALITRGLAEVTRLAVALGGRADTLAGLAGLGDLVLTCTGGLSRVPGRGDLVGYGGGGRADDPGGV